MAEMTSSTFGFYANPSEAALKLQYLGRQISTIEAPAAVVDLSIVKKNCNAMLKTAKTLGVSFRAHVKTHKTTQMTRLQVGETGPVKVIVSTVAEAEQLLPYLYQCRQEGREVNLLYGVPAAPSAIGRLARLSSLLGPYCISVIADHPDTINLLGDLNKHGGIGVGIFVKIDTGYQRAGIKHDSTQLKKILEAISKLESHGDSSAVRLQGFYSHMGNSYGKSSAEEALELLAAEIEGAHAASKHFKAGSNDRKLTLSVGATPTASAAQNLLQSKTPAAIKVSQLISELESSFDVELHAGVYPVLDLQQIATHARPAKTDSADVAPLSYSEIGLRVMVEVASLYDDRERPEALIAAGCLALGREPCKSYPGWGIVTPWRREEGEYYSEENKVGWIVGRVAQEHGILTWEGPPQQKTELKIGQKLMVWPNHACVAGAMFGWYFVVDSENKGHEDEVVDVWVRWRGW